MLAEIASALPQAQPAVHSPSQPLASCANNLPHRWRKPNRTCRACMCCCQRHSSARVCKQDQHNIVHADPSLPLCSPLATWPAALLSLGNPTVKACAIAQLHAAKPYRRHHKRLLGSSGGSSRTRYTRNRPPFPSRASQTRADKSQRPLRKIPTRQHHAALNQEK